MRTKYLAASCIVFLLSMVYFQAYASASRKKNVPTVKPINVTTSVDMTSTGTTPIMTTGFEDNSWLSLLPGWLPKGSYVRKSYVSDTRLSTSLGTVLAGKSSLEYKNTSNKHTPDVYYFGGFSENAATLEYSRKYEPGYAFSCEAKMDGLYALKPNFLDDAGVKPTGTDKFGCKVQIMPNGWYHLGDEKTRYFDPKGVYTRGEPVLYCYHPEQPGKNPMSFGEKLLQNTGSPVYIESGKWYTIKMVLRANTPGKHDGVVEMWINNVLKARYDQMRFRDTADLKINRLELSAWVGGFCSSSKTQRVWDDGLTLSRYTSESVPPITQTGVVITPPEPPITNTGVIILPPPEPPVTNTGIIILPPEPPITNTGITVPPPKDPKVRPADDVDNDGIPNDIDNCVYNYNPDQRDNNKNKKGNECDPSYKGNRLYYDADYDGDGIKDFDNCPYIGNPDQKDADGDEIGDACDAKGKKKK